MPRRALHSFRFLLVVTALLYGGVLARATEGPDERFAKPLIDPTAPHVALLLPVRSAAFVQLAEAVRAGFLAAWNKQDSRALPVRLYPVDDDPLNVAAAYRSALAAGARMVVGPLTRRGVTALAGLPTLITIPTLALNVSERAGATPPNLYTLSLQLEAEARLVARLALGEGRRRALTVSEPSVLARRIRDAFTEEFKAGGGSHIADHVHAGDSTASERLRQASASGAADMLFVALDAVRFRALGSATLTIAVYGTSQLNPGSAAAASSTPDARFVDMPWMVQPDHPAVMVYAQHGAPRRSDDIERLYALGIDASRVAHEVLSGAREIDIDGVTGRLTLGADRQIRRALLVTLITGGKLTVLGETRP